MNWSYLGLVSAILSFLILFFVLINNINIYTSEVLQEKNNLEIDNNLIESKIQDQERIRAQEIANQIEDSIALGTIETIDLQAIQKIQDLQKEQAIEESEEQETIDSPNFDTGSPQIIIR